MIPSQMKIPKPKPTKVKIGTVENVGENTHQGKVHQDQPENCVSPYG
jgi:hypothetical protein